MTSSPKSRTARRQRIWRDQGERSLAHRFPDIADQWDFEKNQANPSQVTPGSNEKMWWRCTKNHSWSATVYTRTNGSRCPACLGMVATPENSLVSAGHDFVATWHDVRNLTELNLRPEDILPQSNKRVWWTCPIDTRHDYQASPAQRFRGRACPYCAGKQVNESNSLSNVAPLLAQEWDPANDKEPTAISCGSEYNASWICRKDRTHRWRARVYSRPTDGAGCPYCAGKIPTDGNRLESSAPKLAAEWHPTLNGPLTPADVTTGSNKPVWWVCPNNVEHVWRVPVRARALDNDGCKFCTPIMRSWVEIALICELAAVFPDGIDPRHPALLQLGHNRPHSVDVLIETLNIVIEFDGSYTHSGEQRELSDRRKTELLRHKGYRVIRLRELPLEPLDETHDISVPKQSPRQDGKILADAVLRHMNELGWVSPSATAKYLSSAHAWAVAHALEIYDSLAPSERFVTYSVKAKRKRVVEAEQISMTLC